ncbi:TniQ family protein [Acinetobacter bereziniae]|uniref:TniQ family protein n=1 Tax=Acinetobacter bereziniae TaxID=106648 RepID=UPI0012509429|nr:TniQ family protein [Acinetobacter bereziniae]
MQERHLIPAIPTPFPDETAGSFLIRLIKLNGHIHSSTFYRSRIDLKYKETLSSIITHDYLFLNILKKFQLPHYLKELSLKRHSSTLRGCVIWKNKLSIPDYFFSNDVERFCPLCLKEIPYWRKIWLVKPYYACLKHQIRLHTTCPRCQSTLSSLRTEVCICSKCLGDIRNCEIEAVSDEQTKHIRWFLEFIEIEEQEKFNLLKIFWSTLKKFSAHDPVPPSIELLLELTYLFFMDRDSSRERMVDWISQRSHQVHPRIQLAPFLIVDTMYFGQYTKKILEQLPVPTELAPEHTFHLLTIQESYQILDICYSTIQRWIRDNKLQYVASKDIPKNRKFLSSLDVEYILVQKALHPPQKKMKLPPRKDGRRLNISDVATKLNVHYENIRCLIRTRYLKAEKLLVRFSWAYYINSKDLEEFNDTYILVSTLAKKLKVTPQNLTEKLASINIHPISGPHIDGEFNNIFFQESVRHLSREVVEKIVNYPTLTGRYPSFEEQLPKPPPTYVSLSEAANKLNISPNKTARLVKKGFLERDISHNLSISINVKSLNALIANLHNPKFISLKQSLIQLNCPKNWFNQYWVDTGFIHVHDFLYWHFIEKNELNEVLKLKKKYLTGTEASTLLGMHKSHVTNLESQGLIEPVYLGTPKIIKLFKRKDIINLKELGYGAIN